MPDRKFATACDRVRTPPRRRLLSTLAAAALLAVPLRPDRAGAAGPAGADIDQPADPGDAAFIRRAFEMRRLAVEQGDQAYGAVVVRHGTIIGQSWSRVILDRDPTGHAEMAAIRDAARRLADRNLRGAILYSSSRPCPMCEAAAYWAGIETMIYGEDATSAGPPQLCR
jgi:tRNA(Arg) A34 adenosine deaminase TadA